MSKNKTLTTGSKFFFTFEGVRFRAKLDRGYSDVKTRVFVDLPEDAGDSIVDRFIKRDRGGDNPELKARRKATRALALAGLEALGLETKGVKYSRYAGCTTCSCSPGFIFPERLGFSIHVESIESIRSRHDQHMESNVYWAKRKVVEAKQAIKKAEAELKKAERGVETSKEKLKAHKAKRAEQKKAARAKARKANKAAEKKAAYWLAKKSC